MRLETKPDWLANLDRDGFCVVPGVIAKEACSEFCDEAYSWLESFEYGFGRDDRSTWKTENLPYGFTGGLYNRYSVNHEIWMWKVRTEPAIQRAFAAVWGTEDLVVSFDGMNATLPINVESGRTDLSPTAPWPRESSFETVMDVTIAALIRFSTDIDQNPRHLDQIQLCQGIANLSPNGPHDGGLVVVRGSHRLHQEYFESIGGFDKSADKGEEIEGYKFTMKDIDWYLERGCEVVKICANAGDLILWDSRTIHWNASPVGRQTRFVLYVAYSPRSLMSESELAKKLQIFRERKGTTGWAHKNVVPEDMIDDPRALPRRPDGKVDPKNRTRPLKEPQESDDVLWAVGVRTGSG